MGITFALLRDRYTSDEERQMDDDNAKLLFYDADGNRVNENSPKAVRQFLSNDPNRPDADGKSKSKAKAAADEDKAVKSPDEDK